MTNRSATLPIEYEQCRSTGRLEAFKLNWKSGQEPVKPRSWLLAIAHNTCMMRFVRSSRRPKEVPLDEAIEQIAMPDHERPNMKAVLEELGKLPFNQRSALAMRELQGRSYEEIAGADRDAGSWGAAAAWSGGADACASGNCGPAAERVRT